MAEDKAGVDGESAAAATRARGHSSAAFIPARRAPLPLFRSASLGSKAAAAVLAARRGSVNSLGMGLGFQIKSSLGTNIQTTCSASG